MGHCVIQADFSSFRPVAGRKCLQLVFEIPIERGEEALRMLGMPLPGENRWCAIALLDTKLVRETATPQPALTNGEREVSGSASTSLQTNEVSGSSKKWSEYNRSQQAAIVCSDAYFWGYFGCVSEAECTAAVKKQLRIKSRKELDTDPQAGKRWDEFLALYRLHQDRNK